MLDYSKPGVGILFTSSAKRNRTIPFKKKNLSRVHSIFSKKCSKHGMNAFFAYHKEYKDGKLMRAWCKYNNRWKLVKNVEVDAIYSRFAGSIYKKNEKDAAKARFKYKMAKQVSLINHPIIDEFCWDKRLVAEMFPELCPRTFLVNTVRGLKLVLGKIRTEKIVLKPRYGTLGRDVIITDKDKLPEIIEKNTIVQEFIDTSKGIKGVTRGMHDMRLFMINGKVDHAHIRIPKKGTLTANIALGGKKVFIPNRLIPKRAVTIARKVDRLFKKFNPRIFSVDFVLNSKGKPFIVECNSQPMIDKYAFGPYARITFYDRVIEAIKSGIKIKVTAQRWNTNK
ncbi:ATP-grasp domain-containing protein [Candidatus Woesearchaeota archaeon]|nr:ATP-grasp domain-containing protein [Candidatus Woesearchaeota archaeon]